MTTTTIDPRTAKTLALIERERQAVIERTGIDVRLLTDDHLKGGLAHDVRRAFNLEKGRRRAIAAGQIPADC